MKVLIRTMFLLGLAVGLVCLFFGGDWLVTGASRIARSLGISALIVGLTIVAMGTSMPELLVSLSAVLNGSADISIGNIVGSNIANIGLILGISGLVYPISVHVNLLRREIPIMIAVALLSLILFQGGEVSQIDGFILTAGMLGFIGFMIYSARREQNIEHNIPEDEEVLEPASVNRPLELGRILVGIGLLLLGAQLTVDNAITLAQILGLSERIIGLTVVAVGTSLPELVTSVTAAFKRESDIAIGNVVGSNIFNVLGILGITSIIKPIAVADQMLTFDTPIMIGFSILLLPLVWQRGIDRREAGILVIGYIGYLIVAFVATGQV